jgi:diguanylate cyclase (GGDEF)-like protein
MAEILRHYATRGIAWYFGVVLAVGIAWMAGPGNLREIDLAGLHFALALVCIVLGVILWVFTESRVAFVLGAAFLSILCMQALATFPVLPGWLLLRRLESSDQSLIHAATVSALFAALSVPSNWLAGRLGTRQMGIFLAAVLLGIVICWTVSLALATSARGGSRVVHDAVRVATGLAVLAVVLGGLRFYVRHTNGLVAGTLAFLLLCILASAFDLHRGAASPPQATASFFGFWALAAVPFGFLLDGVDAVRSTGLYTGPLADATQIDPLTGLHNRRALSGLSTVVFRDNMRGGSPVSVLMLDLDHFKSVNDFYGHAAGDLVLKGFAGIITSSVRSSDITARFGGEEFVIVLPGSPLAPAMRLAERIRVQTENTVFSYEKVRMNLTVSIGAATAFPGEVADFDTLLQVADRNLYRAKRTGRNKVLSNPIEGEE